MKAGQAAPVKFSLGGNQGRRDRAEEALVLVLQRAGRHEPHCRGPLEERAPVQVAGHPLDLGEDCFDACHAASRDKA